MFALRIAMLQTSPRFGAVEENLRAVEDACAGLCADLLVLPELALTGYQFTDRDELARLAEPAGGPSLERVATLAGRAGGHVVLGFAERDGERIFNSAALVGPGGVAGVYRKVHLFADETRLFDPGDRGFPVFEVAGVRLGMMVCFDWIFCESARSLALAGAQVIAHPANLVLPYCQQAMVTRALENRVFTVTVNRVGAEERIPGTPLVFTGRSRLVAPDGRVLADAPEDTPALLEADIDPARGTDKNITPRNHLLHDRRPDQYLNRTQ